MCWKAFSCVDFVEMLPVLDCEYLDLTKIVVLMYLLSVRVLKVLFF